MSITAMVSCWGPAFPVDNEDKLSHHAIRLVALAVADMVSDGHNNEFFMSIDNLSEKVGMHRVTVGRVMSHLAEKKVLSVITRSKYHPTRYRWVWNPETADCYTVRVADCYSTCSNLLHKPNINPKAEPKFTSLAAGISTRRIRKKADVEFGRDTERTVPKPGKERPFGGDSESQPQPKSKPKPSSVVLTHMRLSWPSVQARNTGCLHTKLYDAAPFAKYLNDNFFGPNAKSPMTVEEVLSIVDRFLDDLGKRNFHLKDGQAVWQAFTGRWHNYPVTKVAAPVSGSFSVVPPRPASRSTSVVERRG